MTEKQYRVLTWIARKGYASVTDLRIRASVDDWGFDPGNILRSLERRGYVTQYYGAFAGVTYWEITDAGREGLARQEPGEG